MPEPTSPVSEDTTELELAAPAPASWSVIPKGPGFARFFHSNVTYCGVSLPKPQKTFEEVGLDAAVLENLFLMGFDQPTPIQAYGMPSVCSGRDVVGIAETGCGKTAAYIVPLIHTLLKNRKGGEEPVKNRQVRVWIKGLIVVPTRELAIQVQREALKFSHNTTLRIRILYGGTSINRQREILREGADLVVATAGRLVEFIKSGYIDVVGLQFFAVDEADHIVHKGFLAEVENALMERIPSLGDIQVMMFSATFPESLREEVNRFLHPDHLLIQIGCAGNANMDITQKFVQVDRANKMTALVELIKKDMEEYSKDKVSRHKKRTLVFTNRRQDVNLIVRVLIEAVPPPAPPSPQLTGCRGSRRLGPSTATRTRRTGRRTSTDS